MKQNNMSIFRQHGILSVEIFVVRILTITLETANDIHVSFICLIIIQSASLSGRTRLFIQHFLQRFNTYFVLQDNLSRKKYTSPTKLTFFML